MGGLKKRAAVVGALLVVAVFLGVLIVKDILKEDKKEESLAPQFAVREVIGQSLEGREIEVYTYSNGSERLLFVGGIHGGYEWNSVMLAYEILDYLNEDPGVIPDGVSVSILPNANPDGVYEVVKREGRFSLADVPSGRNASGRFNANGVDLNRNFDCRWQPESMWQGSVVSAGAGPFSEPEARAIRDLVLATEPSAVVFWHSQANAVYASQCEDGTLPETISLMNAYSAGSGYRAVETFDAYEVTGDAEGWLSSIGVPAITVELSSHQAVEFDKNLGGVKSLLDHYSR